LDDERRARLAEIALKRDRDKSARCTSQPSLHEGGIHEN
jgi:hypothetical protein